MHTIRITDRPKDQSTSETFLGGALTVVSRSGLHLTERLLLDNLPRLGAPPASLLVAGNRSGAVTAAAAARFPGCALTCHAFDFHHARAIGRNLGANGLASHLVHDPFVTCAAPLPAEPPPPPAVAVHCTSALPAGPYAAALFMSTPGTMTGELVLDQLEDLHRNLADGGLCLLACEADSVLLAKQVRAIFGNLSVVYDKKGVSCLLAKKRAPLARPRDFSAEFPASLPGLAPCTLTSLPGVFCHRRPDAGGLALAEIAARELTPGRRVLDMGCGCGLVGILLARSQPDTAVTFVDSHARALAATRRNLETLGLLDRSTLVLSDSGLEEAPNSPTLERPNFRTLELPSQHSFLLFVGNPPYYSDFRIAELFIQTAYGALAPGGICLTVAKAARALQERQAERFGHAEVLPRRGYGVVKSIR
ncbi:MAG: methyltransferase [Verrucomicrobiota bacterium]|jgi:16S rRNA (guanine1207-N2)-methyltransferase|nr:methyltransferase [Verrucomicrobiota bacterium]